LKKDYQILIVFGTNIPDTTGRQMTLGEVGTWMVIWWPVVSGIFVPKTIKIWQRFFNLQSIMSGMLFWDTM